jgi:hypothetical protein
MTIDCILRTWYKNKGEEDKRFYEVPIYQIQLFNNTEYDIKWELQIVALDEDGNPSTVLAKKEFIPDGKSIHYIHFHTVNYCYNEVMNQIYTTQTIREI